MVLLNTCAIRDKAEARIWGQLQLLKHTAQQVKAPPWWSREQSGTTSSAKDSTLPTAEDAESRQHAMQAQAQQGQRPKKQVVGLLGCMAERLKDKLLDGGMVDVIAGLHHATQFVCACLQW